MYLFLLWFNDLDLALVSLSTRPSLLMPFHGLNKTGEAINKNLLATYLCLNKRDFNINCHGGSPKSFSDKPPTSTGARWLPSRFIILLNQTLMINLVTLIEHITCSRILGRSVRIPLHRNSTIYFLLTVKWRTHENAATSTSGCNLFFEVLCHLFCP